MNHEYKNRQCRNYEPINFETGFCHFHRATVLAEGHTCQFFDRIPRCLLCKHYESSVAGYLGICRMLSSEPMTFPDRMGVTCDHFEWNR